MLELFTAAFASQDDAEEHLSNGAVTVDSGDLDLGNDNGQDQVIGLRFDQIGIPKGATITGAYLQFTA
ncbi:MAG: hypothetical protein M9908_15815, partial [Phyllobacteriaceae bacterium]|nr:hypothetical protein [Phyllobacteriaceae bacterium]